MQVQILKIIAQITFLVINLQKVKINYTNQDKYLLKQETNKNLEKILIKIENQLEIVDYLIIKLMGK